MKDVSHSLILTYFPINSYTFCYYIDLIPIVVATGLIDGVRAGHGFYHVSIGERHSQSSGLCDQHRDDPARLKYDSEIREQAGLSRALRNYSLIFIDSLEVPVTMSLHGKRTT